jgi:hypothetical protein
MPSMSRKLCESQWEIPRFQSDRRTRHILGKRSNPGYSILPGPARPPAYGGLMYNIGAAADKSKLGTVGKLVRARLNIASVEYPALMPTNRMVHMVYCIRGHVLIARQ